MKKMQFKEGRSNEFPKKRDLTVSSLIEQFQQDRAEWHSAPIREILAEYEEWRCSEGAADVVAERNYWIARDNEKERNT